MRQPQPNSRVQILDRVLSLVRDGQVVSLESAARAAGLTKPGLMYHFSTKEALMTALVDHLADRYQRELVKRIPDRDSASAADRLAAYLDWALTAAIDRADLVAFSDPRLRDELTRRWAERLGRWVEVPESLPRAYRARLLAVRLIADGSWFADASGVFALDPEDRRAVLTLAQTMLGESS